MRIPLPRPPSPVPSDLSGVTLGEGPPTRGELAKYYPARYTWRQLTDFIKSGNLGLLKRDPVLQKRYNIWAAGIAKEHGSITNYLVNVRLGWGPRLETATPPTATTSPSSSVPSLALNPDAYAQLEPSQAHDLPYFTSTASPDHVKIIFNDWPYSVPPEISHYVIWTRLPVVHPALIHPSIESQVERHGLWGFTGLDRPNSAEGDAAQNVAYDDVAPSTSPTARAHILVAAAHIHRFVSAHWPEDEWEVAWFVNPPRLQSVKDLSHIHVFARRK